MVIVIKPEPWNLTWLPLLGMTNDQQKSTKRSFNTVNKSSKMHKNAQREVSPQQTQTVIKKSNWICTTLKTYCWYGNDTKTERWIMAGHSYRSMALKSSK